MQGIGYIIALFIFIIMGFLPLITIIIAKYITLFEKIVWLGVYIFGTFLLMKSSSNGGDFLLFTLTLFITFKIIYTRRKAIWLEKTNKT